MSFGGSGFGFGQNNQQQQSTGFSGFGTNTNTNTGFGTSGNTFGASNTAAAPASGLFGSPAAGGAFGSTTGGFGSSGGAFGAAKPAFGAAPTTTGGGLFGSTTATTTNTGGFGSTSGFGATPVASSGFGSTGLFGGSKPATTTSGFGSGTTFGAAPATTSLFGGGANTGTVGTAFGATNNPGLGTNVTDPPGTAAVAFTPTIEKETNNPSQSNSFQNILFMDAYKKWSSEELRLADYNQGRKMGGTGGTGAFGGSGFGGGFGTTTQATPGFGTAAAGGGMFGSQTTQPATGGFGTPAASNTGGAFGGGGLFGAAKPATTGLFGTPQTQQPAQSGGLFGGGGFGTTSNTTGNAFGQTTAPATGGGLFGNTAAAPAKTGFSFGTGGTTQNAFGNTGSTGGFGTTAPATNTGTGLFGNTAQTNTTGGGLFGNTQQQQPAATGFGTGFGAAQQQPAQNTGTGLFGNQAKPAGGLFGSTPAPAATGGLFGNTQAAAPFGTANTAQPTGNSLFGGAKPAGSTGLFGSSTAGQAANTGTGGLFGNLGASTQNAQQGQSSLFGNMGGQNQAKPSLFGTQPTTGGSSLFGTQPVQQQTGLFNSMQQPQQQQQQQGSSLFGNSQGNQQQQQSFSTSINDISAYGSATLFSNVPENQMQNLGPLATPLSGKNKVKSRSILPMYKLSPANASRLVTPQKRGYGFSYSTYGTPSSPSSAASTPGGLGQSLLAGSINRGLSKSISASNLRRSFNVEDSILTPGAFSASSGPRLLGNSSLHKKLIINRDMRSDLFTSPNKAKDVQDTTNGPRKLTKRVSFETRVVDTPENGSRGSPRDSPENNSNTADDTGYLRPASRPATNGVNGSKSSPGNQTPEAEQVKGNELAIVHEEESPVAVRSSEKKPGQQIEAGAYWMSPTADEIRAMNRVQRQKVANFVVGRENVGSVSFKVPVDLTNIDLDHLFDNIVVLEPRSATVYPIAAKKPAEGKGLNVPALISLEHSFPRGGASTSGRRLERHIERLRTAIVDTTFEDYDRETGVWTFSVKHFTTYGLDDDDVDDADVTDAGPMQTTIPQLPSAVAQVAQLSQATQEDSTSSPIDPDDTFDFKRSRRAVPGAFDEGALSDEEEHSDNAQPQGMSSPDLKGADAPIPSQEWYEDEMMVDGQDVYQPDLMEQDSESQLGSIDGQDDLARSYFANNDSQVPAGIMRARMRAVKRSTAPTKIEVTGGDDWTHILQASVRAPRTVDRATLRALNESGAVWDMKDRGSPAPQNTSAQDGVGFATSIDLMKSLFEQAKGPSQSVQAAPARGFVKLLLVVKYLLYLHAMNKRPKVDTEDDTPLPRPRWGPNEVLLTTHNGETTMQPVDDNVAPPITNKQLSQLQQYIESISSVSSPDRDSYEPSLRDLAQGDPVWELASLLFDDNGANLASFWRQLVSDATDFALGQASTQEEKAIVCLSGNRVADACGHLLASRNFRLANLVSCIGTQNNDIRTQLKDWRESNVLAEIPEPIRALYELLAGNACVCAGVKNVPLENRVESFTISQRFGLDWMQSFGLRLFYAGSRASVADAIISFQADIEQDKEPEPNSPLWSLLKSFALRQFDWSEPRLGWLLTKAVWATHTIDFGEDEFEKIDKLALSYAAALTAQSQWVPATAVLLHLSSLSAVQVAVRDHLGRHAHAIGSPFQKDPNSPSSPFTALRKFHVPDDWIWEAKALDFRSRQDSRQEFLALVWAGNYVEANTAFVNRVGPDLVIKRDFKRLFSFAELLFKVRKSLPDWDTAAAVYLLYPLVLEGRRQRRGPSSEREKRLDGQLVDGLAALRAKTHGDVRQEAAIADMAEELIKAEIGGQRLYGLLPEDIRVKYLRARALGNVR
ncbi:putative nuclear pore protein [Podospora appendiculata]|uniref:Nuclear pore protein n=1 Tax=Podospora appendiculata TaxID=314037 RepID=A0AAE0X0U9_9PEZI|nr:putative nuclear pore protein [Podospora appendiculata]